MLSQYIVEKTKIDWQRFNGFCPRENNPFFFTNMGCLPFIKKIPEILVENFRSVRMVHAVVYHLPKIFRLSRCAILDSGYNMKLVQNSRNL